ncbi:MAG: hypothetical protein ACEQSR_12105, partial [Candidatus Methylacidiphilales bacterium]
IVTIANVYDNLCNHTDPNRSLTPHEALSTIDIDGGKEKVSANLPLVVSAQKELTEPRIPNMRGIMAARTKPLKVVEPTTSELTSAAVGFELPAPKGSVKLISVEDAGSLISILHNEAKII